MHVPGRSFVIVYMGNCVWFLRMCRGGFGCSRGGGGGGGGCVLCSRILVGMLWFCILYSF